MDRRAFTAYNYSDILRRCGYADIIVTRLQPYVLRQYEWLNWDESVKYNYDPSEYVAWLHGKPLIRGGITILDDCFLLPSFAITKDMNPKILFKFVKEVLKIKKGCKWRAYVGKNDLVAQDFAKHFKFVQVCDTLEDNLLLYERV